MFINAFGRFHGYLMSNGGYDLIANNATPDASHYDSCSLRGHTNAWALGSAIRTYAIDRYETTATAELREVNEVERHWFMTKGLGVYVAGLLHDLKYDLPHTLRYRLNDLADSMARRAGGRRNGGIAEYKGRRLSAYDYRESRNFCKMMGQLIREAIHTDDASHCEEVFMDNYDHHSSLHHTVFEGMQKACNDKGLSLRNEVLYCDHIGEPEYRARVSGRLRYFCESCMENDDVVVYANDTEEHISRGDAYYDDYNDQWLAHEPDSDDPDDNDRNTDRLMSYSTNALDHVEKDASIISAPFGNFLLGVEFEMVTSGEVNDAVEDVRDQLGADYCICKSDGSLPDGGLEIVTAPRGLDEHIANFKGWNIHSGYSAWKNGRCGMHVHIDSRAFTSLTLGKFIMLMNAESNAEFIRKIAGRHPLMDSQARSYCRTETQSELTNPSKALKGKSNDRYTMVNIANLKRAEAKRLGVPSYDSGRYNTIELRIFRASLKKERLLAQIEFTHAAVMFCRVASMRDLDGVSFLKWLKTTNNRYPHLADWYGVRRRPTAKGAEPAEVKCEDAVPVLPPAPPSQRRHNIDYPLFVNQGDDALQFIDRNNLHAEYAGIHGTEVMYFPYGSYNRIGDTDVVYTLEDDQWVLQPVGTLANTDTTEHSL
jgi:hypothetical protein